MGRAAFLPPGLCRDDSSASLNTIVTAERCRPTRTHISYAGTGKNKVSQEGLRLFGNGFGTALRQFIGKNQFTIPTDNTRYSDNLDIGAAEYTVSAGGCVSEPINLTVTGTKGGAAVGIYLEQTDGTYSFCGKLVFETLKDGQSTSVELQKAPLLEALTIKPLAAPALTLDEKAFPKGRRVKLVWRPGNFMLEPLRCPVTHSN